MSSQKKRKANTAVTLSADVDVNAALQCGDAFFKLAQPFISSVPSGFDDAQQHASENLGDMSAAAVNLALAIEIYLKALIAGSGKSYPNEHTLAVLYDELPSELKERVQVAYEKATVHQGADDLETAALLVEVVRQGSNRPPVLQKPFPRGFKALLQRNARNFVAWRYLFSSETKVNQPLSFEFRNMVIGARILRSLFPEVVPIRV